MELFCVIQYVGRCRRYPSDSTWFHPTIILVAVVLVRCSSPALNSIFSTTIYLVTSN